MSSYAHVVYTTAKQVISRHGKNENACEMSQNEKCTCKECKTFVFHCQICKFVGFLLPSSSRLLKLPIEGKVTAPTVAHSWEICSELTLSYRFQWKLYIDWTENDWHKWCTVRSNHQDYETMLKIFSVNSYLHNLCYLTEEWTHLRMNTRRIPLRWCKSGYSHWELNSCIHSHLVTHQEMKWWWEKRHGEGRAEREDRGKRKEDGDRINLCCVEPSNCHDDHFVALEI